MLCADKLLIWVSVLVAFLYAPAVFAFNVETQGGCPDGEEADDQREPHCCKPLFMVFDEESGNGKKCVEQPSNSSVAVAITLILSFTFLISLQCFMNHHDVDLREYAYTVISQTVSIFSAVLTFQSLDGLVQDMVIEPLQESTGLGQQINLCINFFHMLFWYSATQHTIAFTSCAMKPDDWRQAQLEAAHHGQRESRSGSAARSSNNTMLDIEINTVCFGLVLAHLTGFAAINFWTDLQQIEPFSRSPLTTLALIPVALLSQMVFESFVSERRLNIISRGGQDWFANTWIEKCQSAEDDIMGLSVSVMIVNSLRFAINKLFGHNCLPNSGQKEVGSDCEFQHTISGALCLLACGMVFVGILCMTKFCVLKFAPEHKKEQLKLKRAQSKRRMSLLAGGVDDEDQEAKTQGDRFLERLHEVTLIILSMAHSWCFYHGVREFLMAIDPNFLGREENATALSVGVASAVTYFAFIKVRILDLIADLPDEWTPEDVDHTIKTVIGATSIFIGFAWEQTFDESIDSLSERTRLVGGRHAPAVAKLLIGSACIGVVFLAWKWYILPFVFKKGWRYGYIYSRHDLEERCHELAEHDASFDLPFLHGIAQTLSEKDPKHKTRFSLANHLQEVTFMPEDDSYESLPSTEAEAMRAEIVELKNRVRYLEQQLALHDIARKLAENNNKQAEAAREENQGLKIHARYLEQQLADERNAAMEWKLHRSFLEQQLTEERKARLDIKTRCETCGQAFTQGQLIEEAKASNHLLEFLEKHLEDQSKARACYSDVGVESVGNQNVSLDSRSSVTRSSELAEESNTPTPPSAFFSSLLEGYEATAAQRFAPHHAYKGEEVVLGCPKISEPQPPPVSPRQVSPQFASVLCGKDAGNPSFWPESRSSITRSPESAEPNLAEESDTPTQSSTFFTSLVERREATQSSRRHVPMDEEMATGGTTTPVSIRTEKGESQGDYTTRHETSAVEFGIGSLSRHSAHAVRKDAVGGNVTSESRSSLPRKRTDIARFGPAPSMRDAPDMAQSEHFYIGEAREERLGTGQSEVRSGHLGDGVGRASRPTSLDRRAASRPTRLDMRLSASLEKRAASPSISIERGPLNLAQQSSAEDRQAQGDLKKCGQTFAVESDTRRLTRQPAHAFEKHALNSRPSSSSKSSKFAKTNAAEENKRSGDADRSPLMEFDGGQSLAAFASRLEKGAGHVLLNAESTPPSSPRRTGCTEPSIAERAKLFQEAL